ncbi:TPA: restriction endonuclease subunit S [Aeromonas hydrophila]|uniref:restriction endonuclease subunit S n=1 Tax=Aeromonas dhakensis TaxID=196024 RepID=UPI0028DE3F5E|nr:type I restriction-modification protein subunit S [Aeromonas dhakensis]HEA3130961.1 restriction endonuclease subunit S [Aeromonas hydrophila]
MSEAVATSQQELVEKYQPYPEYDDSGIEWLGRIPVHWKLATLKHECVFSGGGTPTKDNLAYWGGDIPWISPKDMKSQVVTDSIDKITAVAVAESSTKLVPEGALLMVVRSGILQRTIPVAINTVPVTLNQDMKSLRFKSKDKACFFLYYIQGLESQLLLEWCKQGATVESIEHDLLANARYPLPPNDELKAINQFLDYETARIDRLITQQLRLIELLKEKRQAVISHAVTKGLNPNAPMKDSGIEWLGQVPKHWNISKIRYVAKLESGHTPSRNKPEYWNDCYIPWVSLSDVWQLRSGRQIYIGDTKEKISDLGIANSAARLLPKGTVILSRTASVGFVGIMAESMATTQDFANWVCGERIISEYLYFSLISMQLEFKRLMMGSTHKTIYMPDIQELLMAVPSKNEQVEIVAHILRKTEILDSAVDRAEKIMGLLSERRTALISAAVTGKIDLRGWTPPAEEAAA